MQQQKRQKKDKRHTTEHYWRAPTSVWLTGHQDEPGQAYLAAIITQVWEDSHNLVLVLEALLLMYLKVQM